jgi:CO dehydrogenase maturation factor
MKIAISGKGGVGKTTLAALLARIALDQGSRVIAIDADPDANLAATLGHPDPDGIVPLTMRKDLIDERVGSGGMIRLNPRVDDLAGMLGSEVDGINLVVLGSIPRGGSGCFCPPSALLKAFLTHTLVQPEEWVIVDMEAGLEHLGRGSSAAVDCLLVVVEPTKRSVETAHRIAALATDLGVRRLGCVVNKIESDEQVEEIRAALGAIPLAGTLPRSPALAGFAPRTRLQELDPGLAARVRDIHAFITEKGASR